MFHHVDVFRIHREEMNVWCDVICQYSLINEMGHENKLNECLEKANAFLFFSSDHFLKLFIRFNEFTSRLEFVQQRSKFFFTQVQFTDEKKKTSVEWIFPRLKSENNSVFICCQWSYRRNWKWKRTVGEQTYSFLFFFLFFFFCFISEWRRQIEKNQNDFVENIFNVFDLIEKEEEEEKSFHHSN